MEADEEGNNDDAPPAKGGGRAVASVMTYEEAQNKVYNPYTLHIQICQKS